MALNLLPSENRYTFSDSPAVRNRVDVLYLVKRFLRERSPADEEQLNTMMIDIREDRNHVVRFTEGDEPTVVPRHGTRISYGAFRHSALEHSTQTVWSYTFEIVETDEEQIKIRTDNWGWLHGSDLENKVSALLE